MIRSTFIAILFLSVASALAQAPRYMIHDLGPISERSSVYPLNAAVTGINIRGQVIGFDTRTDGTVRSFRTSPNAAINWATDEIGTLGGRETWAFGINASGQVAGASTLASGEIRGFRTAPNRPIQTGDNIGTMGQGAMGSVARAINDSGQVTGSSGPGMAFVTGPNLPINPATDGIRILFSGYYPTIEGRYVNSRGHVLGDLTHTYPTAFIAVGREIKSGIHTRAPNQTYIGFTDRDEIILNYDRTVLVWRDGRRAPLGECTVTCYPNATNNSLQLVGGTQTGAFLLAGGVFYDLNSLIQNGSGWDLSPTQYLQNSYFINDLGQIAGVGRINNEARVFRLDPMPSAASAIQQTMNLVRSLPLDRRGRSTLPLMIKTALVSKLLAALDSWNRGNPAATRGFLNEFQNTVRAHTGTLLSVEQANRLIEMAEAAIALT